MVFRSNDLIDFRSNDHIDLRRYKPLSPFCLFLTLKPTSTEHGQKIGRVLRSYLTYRLATLRCPPSGLPAVRLNWAKETFEKKLFQKYYTRGGWNLSQMDPTCLALSRPITARLQHSSKRREEDREGETRREDWKKAPYWMNKI